MTFSEDRFSFDEIEDKPKRKHDETSWQDFWKAIGIFALAMLLLTFVGTIMNRMIISADHMDAYQDIVLGDMTETPELSALLGNYMNSLENPANILLYSVLSVVLVILVMLFVYGVVHFFATRIQGGAGSYKGLVVRANLPTIISYSAYALSVGFLGMWVIMQVVNQFDGTSIYASQAAYEEYMQIAQQQSIGLGIIAIGTFLLWSIWMSSVVGRNYNLTQSRGCLTIFLSNLVLFALGCGLIMAFSYGLYNMLAL